MTSNDALRPRSFGFYVCVLVAAAAIAAYRASAVWPVYPGVALVLLAIVAFVAEGLAVSLPRGGTLSISYPISLAALILLGPTAGSLVAALPWVNPGSLRLHRSLSVTAFNVSQVVISVVCAGTVYSQLGGRFLLDWSASPVGFRPLTSADFPGVLLPFAALAATSFLLNGMFVSIAVALKYGQRLRDAWLTNVAWMIPTQMALAILGLLIAEVIAVQGVVGFVLFLTPLMVARQTFQRYLELKDAYLETVRSLVAAIEAKDKYTAGHSERVASYAVRIGREIGLNVDRLERVEFAALLHDLGKIGVPHSVLLKKGRLDSGESQAILRHPEVGARLVARIPFLSDLADVIASHHERYDGAGYNRGLSGDQIPLESRILAVADSYDAMTSQRPYRMPLGAQRAIDEVGAQGGAQYDPEVVSAFLRISGALTEDGMAEETSPDASR